MKRISIGLGMLLVLGACSGGVNQLTIDGQSYSGKARADRDDRAQFVAQAGPASASLENARQAAAFEAVQYCIDYLGTSDIAWINPPDAPEEALLIDNNEVVVQGRCVER